MAESLSQQQCSRPREKPVCIGTGQKAQILIVFNTYQEQTYTTVRKAEGISNKQINSY